MFLKNKDYVNDGIEKVLLYEFEVLDNYFKIYGGFFVVGEIVMVKFYYLEIVLGYFKEWFVF